MERAMFGREGQRVGYRGALRGATLHHTDDRNWTKVVIVEICLDFNIHICLENQYNTWSDFLKNHISGFGAFFQTTEKTWIEIVGYNRLLSSLPKNLRMKYNFEVDTVHLIEKRKKLHCMEQIFLSVIMHSNLFEVWNGIYLVKFSYFFLYDWKLGFDRNGTFIRQLLIMSQ